MATDRYGIEAVYAFEARGNSIALMSQVERGLSAIETAVERTAQAVKRANVGGVLQSSLREVKQAEQGIGGIGRVASLTGKEAVQALKPLQHEFRTLKAEAKTIDFGNLSNPQQFSQAKQSVETYIRSLEQLETQVQGNGLAERQLKANMQGARQAAQAKIDTTIQQQQVELATRRSQMATGVAATATATAAPLIGIGIQAVNVTSGFDDQLAEVEAVMDRSQRTTANMKQIRDEAKYLGATTRFSARDAAEGFVLLAQAGHPVEKQLKEIKGTMALAAAGNLSMASATGFTVSALGQFQLEAEQAKHVADVFAYAANAGQLDVAQLGATLEYSGQVANTYGASIEQAAAMTAYLSKAGIEGSEAGTALRSVFLNLAAGSGPAKDALARLGISVADASGKMRPIDQVLQNVGKSMQGLSDPERMGLMRDIFGTEAIGAAQFLMQDVDAWRTMTEAAYKSSEGMGSAAESAKIMEAKIGGSFRNLSSAAEGVLIEIGEILVPVVKLVVDGISTILSAFIQLPKPVKTAIVIIGAAIATIATITAVVAGGMAVWFGFQAMIVAAGLELGVMAAILGPLAGVVTPIVAAFGAGGLAGALGAIGTMIAGLGGTIAGFAGGALAALTSPIGLTIAAVVGLYAAIEYLTPGFNLLGAILSVVGGVLGFVFGIIKGLINGIWNGLAPAVQAVSNILKPFAAVMGNAFGSISPALTQAAESFKYLADVGTVVGQVIGVVLSAPFWLIGRAVNAVILLLQGKWGQFAQYVIDSFLAIPRAVKGVIEKLTPPFMRKGTDSTDNQVMDGAVKASPPSPTSLPVAQPPKPFVPAGNFEDAFFRGAPASVNSANNIVPFNRPAPTSLIPIASPTTTPPIALAPIATPTISASVSSIPPSAPLSIPPISVPQTVATVTAQSAPVAIQPAALAPVAMPAIAPQSTVQALQPAPLITIDQPVAVSLIPTISPLDSIAQEITRTTPALQAQASLVANQVTQTFNQRIEQSKAASFKTVVAVDTQPIGEQLSQISADTATFVNQATTAISQLDFASATNSVIDYGLKVGQSASSILGHLGGIAIGAIAFGITALSAFSPVLLILGGVALAIFAISTNFLGLRSVLQGVIQVVTGLLDGFFMVGRGVVQVARGLIQIFGGVVAAIRGDFSVMRAGINQVFLGIGNVARGIARAVSQTFLGAIATIIGAVRGTVRTLVFLFRLPATSLNFLGETASAVTRFISAAFRGVGEWLGQIFGFISSTASRAFGSINSVSQRTASILGAVLEIPEQAWRSFLALVDQIKSRIQSLQALSGKAVEGVKNKFNQLLGRKTPVTTPVSTELLQQTTTEQPTAPASQVILTPAVRVQRSQESQVNLVEPLPNLPAPALPPVSAFQAPAATPSTQTRNQSIPGLSQDTIPKAPAISISSISPSPSQVSTSQAILADLDRVENTLVQKQGKIVTSTNQALNSMGMALSGIAPQAAAPLLAISSFVDSIGSLKTALPELKEGIKLLTPGFSALKEGAGKAFTTLRSGGVSLGALRSMAGGGAVAMRTAAASTIGSLLSVITSVVTGNTVAAGSFGTLGATATAAWTAVIAPALPFIAIGAGVIAVIGLIYLAFRRNFLGINTLVQGFVAGLRTIANAIGAIIGGVITAIGYLLKFAIAFSPIGVALVLLRSLFIVTATVIKGTFSALGAIFGALLRGFLAPFEPLFQAFARLTDMVQGAIAFLARVFNGINQLADGLLGVGKGADLVSNAFKQFGNLLLLPLQALSSIAFGVGALLSPFAAIFLVIKGIAWGISTIFAGISKVASAAALLFNPLQAVNSIFKNKPQVASITKITKEEPLANSTSAASTKQIQISDQSAVQVPIASVASIAPKGAISQILGALKGLAGTVFGVLSRIGDAFTALGAIAGATWMTIRTSAVEAVASIGGAFRSSLLGIGTLVTRITSIIQELINFFIGGIGQIAKVAAELLTPFKAIGSLFGARFGAKPKDATLPTSPITTPTLDTSSNTNQMQSDWLQFSNWFEGTMQGLVGVGQKTGSELIDALNHSPTEKIPNAWYYGLEKIFAGFGTWIGHARETGNFLVRLLTNPVETLLPTSWKNAISNVKAQFGIWATDARETANKIGWFFVTPVTMVKTAFATLRQVMLGVSLTSVLSLAPMLLILAGIAIAVFLVSRNFLGLKTILAGLTGIAQGVLLGIKTAIQGLVQVVRGALNIIKGLFTFDLELIRLGFKDAFGGMSAIAQGVAIAIQATFKGALAILSGLLQGFRQAGTFAFHAVGLTATPVKAVVQGIGSAVNWMSGLLRSTPAAIQQSWQGFLNLLHEIKLKLEGVANAVTNSPVGKLVQGVTNRITGNPPSTPQTPQTPQVSQSIKPQPTPATPVQPQTQRGLARFFPFRRSQPVQPVQPAAPPIIPQTPGTPASASIQALPISQPENLNNLSRQAPRLPKGAGRQTTQSAQAEQAIDETGTRATRSLGAATDAASSLSAVVGTIAPGLAAPIAGFSALLSGVLGLMTSVPMLMGLITGSQAAATASNAALATSTNAVSIATIRAGMVTTWATVKSAAQATWNATLAASNWVLSTSNAALTASTNAVSMATIRAGMVTTWATVKSAAQATWNAALSASNWILSLSFSGIGAAATTAWTAVLAPILPLVLAIGALIAVIAVIYLAFKNNFLGIGTLVKSVMQGIIDFVLIPFQIIKAAIGGIIQVIRAIFQPILIVAQVIVEAVSEPVKALIQSVKEVWGSLKALFATITQPLQVFGDLWNQVTGSMGQAGGKAGGLGQAFKAIVQTVLLPLRVAMAALTVSIKAVAFVLQVVITAIGLIFRGLQIVGGVVWNMILAPFKLVAAIIGGVGAAIGAIAGVMTAVGNAILTPFRAVGAFIDSLKLSLSTIPFIGQFFGGEERRSRQRETPVQRFASGGFVQGSGNTDSIPAMLTPNEYVMNPIAVRLFYPLLEMMNTGKLGASPLSLLPPSLPSMPAIVPQLVGAGAGIGAASDRPVQITLNIENINVGGGSGGGSTNSPQAMALEMIDQLLPYLERAVVDLLRDKVEKSRG